MSSADNRDQEQTGEAGAAAPLREQIAQAIGEHEVILFMKGTPEAPACGFSARASAILKSTGRPFAAIDVLADPRIRQELSALSNWPTIPQLFIRGELVGGCDIVTEMHESGELQEMLGATAASEARGEAGTSPGDGDVSRGSGPPQPVAPSADGFTPVENKLA
jgi:monothiol glutaredoxin